MPSDTATQETVDTSPATTDDAPKGVTTQQGELPPTKRDAGKSDTASANGSTSKKSDPDSVSTVSEYERQLRKENETERKRRQDLEKRSEEIEKELKELKKYRDDRETEELAAQKKHAEIAEKERKRAEKLEKDLEAERAEHKRVVEEERKATLRERLLDRAEILASQLGIIKDHSEDLRIHLERRLDKDEKGEITFDTLSDIVDGYKTSKARWFKDPESTTTASTNGESHKTEVDAAKPKKATPSVPPARKDSGTEAKTDWSKSSSAEWQSYMNSLGVKVGGGR
jgi:vacuolar-type H+-ATPase subunit I/STV1